MEHVLEAPESVRRSRSIRWLLGALGALLVTLAGLTGAAWAWSRRNVVRFGHTLLVGPASTGDHWIDGSNTQVTIDERPPAARSITIRHAFRPGEVNIYQFLRPQPRFGRVVHWVVKPSASTVYSIDVRGFGGYLVIDE